MCVAQCIHAVLGLNAPSPHVSVCFDMYILRVGVVDIVITTTKSPALDIAALCLDSSPAAIFAQILISDSCQRLHVSFVK